MEASIRRLFDKYGDDKRSTLEHELSVYIDSLKDIMISKVHPGVLYISRGSGPIVQYEGLTYQVYDIIMEDKDDELIYNLLTTSGKIISIIDTEDALIQAVVNKKSYLPETYNLQMLSDFDTELNKLIIDTKMKMLDKNTREFQNIHKVRENSLPRLYDRELNKFTTARVIDYARGFVKVDAGGMDSESLDLDKFDIHRPTTKRDISGNMIYESDVIEITGLPNYEGDCQGEVSWSYKDLTWKVSLPDKVINLATLSENEIRVVYHNNHTKKRE